MIVVWEGIVVSLEAEAGEVGGWVVEGDGERRLLLDGDGQPSAVDEELPIIGFN